MKLCKTCGETKSLELFSKCSRNSDGLQSKCKSCFSEYYKSTAEIQKARFAEWRSNPENAERARETRRAYKASEHGRMKIKSLKSARRARERGAHLVDPDISDAFKIVTGMYGNVCMYPECDRIDIELDHVVPLSLGGTHSISNLQVLCEHHNRAKGNRSCADYRNLELVI